MDKEHPLRAFLHTAVRGYVFWTLFFGIGPIIWFYPMSLLEISGYEPFVLVLFLPIILELRILKRLLQAQWCFVIVQGCSLVGIGSFLSSDMFTRLCWMTVGTGAAMLQFAHDFMAREAGSRKLVFWAYTLAYFALLTGRVLWRSLSPAWTDTLSCVALLTVCLLDLLDQLVNPVEGESTTVVAQPKTLPEDGSTRRSVKWPLVSAGLGSWLFLVQWLFSDVSVLCRWATVGYPVSGPNPNPWGMAVYVSLLFGLALAAWLPALSTSPLWCLTATMAFYVLYLIGSWQGFGAGLVLAAFTTSVWPRLFANLCQCPLPRTLALAIILYLVEIFYSVWTVAYNFVPLGVHTREFSGLLIAVIMTSLSVAVLHSCSAEEETFRPLIHDEPSSLKVSNGSSKAVQHIKISQVSLVLITGFLVACGGMAVRFHRYDPEANYRSRSALSQPGDPKILTAMLWTFHFGYANDGWPSLEQTVDLIRHIDADVIGLLETDASKPYMGCNDLTAWLAERLNMYSDFGPATQTHTWGCVLLSSYPIVQSTHLLLPSPEGELAPAIAAVLNVSGQHVGVVVTHMGNDRDNLDRQLQTWTLSNVTADFYARQLPTIFLGYVTSAPGSRDYRHLTSAGRLKDIDPTDTERWCEYILYSRLGRLAYGRISHAHLTDTEIQVDKFIVPEKGSKFSDNEEVIRDQNDPLIPSYARLSPVFGDFYSGHFSKKAHHYHMNTPKYFV